MTQLFLNLAINACEAMDYDGELRITAKSSADAQWCELMVIDTGPGIKADVRDDLFKPFVTTKKSGTGLGLPMVARITHAHGGDVLVEESPSGGAAFCVRLQLPETDGSRGKGFSAATERDEEKEADREETPSLA